MAGTGKIVVGTESGAPWRAPGSDHFADFRDLAGSKYAYCQNSLVLAPREGARTIACRELIEPDVFSGLIDRFAVQYPNSDRRAVVSMWTLYYFSTLTIAMAVVGLEMRLLAPIALDDASVCVDPETAAPLAFQLPELGRKVEGMSFAAALAPMLRDHAEPLIAAMVRNERVGRRMLWNNVAAYLDWMVAEIGRASDRPEAAGEAELYRLETWPGGMKNPLFGLIRSEQDEKGETHGCRKVCCLRYSLPGVGGCGFSCPLPQGRQ